MKSRAQKGKIEQMPPQQQKQLRDWMNEGLIYTEIQRRARETFGISISTSSLSVYYSKHERAILASQKLGIPSAETLQVTLVIHLQIRPELLQLASSSNGK